MPAGATRGDVFARERQAAHRPDRRGARPCPRRATGRAVRRLRRHDPQGPAAARDRGSPRPDARRRDRPGAGSRPERAFDIRERLQQRREGRDRSGGRGDGRGRREHRPRREHDGARGRPAPQGPGRLEPADRHHERAAASPPSWPAHPGITVVMPGGFVRWEALSVVGQLGDGLFEQDQRPEGVRRCRGVHARVRPERRHRRGGPDQALDGRRRPRGHRASSTAPSGNAPRSRRSARPTRSTSS